MTYILKINKTVKESNVLFDCEHDEDLIQIIDKIDYTQAKINDGAKVTYTVICEGYESTSNTLVMDKDYELTPEIKKLVTLTIKADPEDSTIIFTYKKKDYKQNSIVVTSNTPVKYTISRMNRETVSNILMIDKDTTLEIKLGYRLNTDEDIANYEKNNTDPLSNIKVLSKKEYDSLTDDLRRKHIKLNDQISNLLGVDYNLTLNDCIVQLYWMLPIANKLTPFTNGTLGQFQSDFINYLSQLNALLVAANGVGNKIKSMRKALKKAGLSSLTDVLTTGFGLIGGLAGIVYGIMNNPNIFIKTYAQAFEDIDLQEIYERTIGETLPNLDYVKGMLNRTYIPEGNLKKNLFDQLEQVDAAADLSLEVIEMLGQLKQMVEVANSSEEAMKEIIKAMSTMSLGWAIGSLSDSISRLHKDRDKIKSNMNNSQLADAFNVMKENIDKMRNIPDDYYISEDDFAELKKINDERTSTEQVMDYQNGYDDAFQNAQNGETEFQMDLKLAKLKKEMEALGKDPSAYIYGYKVGWESGRKKYENELKNLTTDEQKESYAIGYEDGYNFGKVIKGLASNSLDVGELKWFIDMDNHIHYTNLYPFGRIEGTKVYDFSVDRPEEEIGTYNPSTETIYITAEDKFYLIVDNRYIYDTSIQEEQTDEKLQEVMEILYKINVIRVERKPAENTINPYYAKGYVVGFADREEDNIEIDDTTKVDDKGYYDGYEILGRNNESHNKITEWIDNYSQENPDNYEFYNQGLVRGYNTYNAEYNSGYNNAWFNSMKNEDYDEGESPEEARTAYLEDFCIKYNLDKAEQDSLPDNKKNAYYLGAINGWDDAFNGIEEPNYRQSYYLNN